MLHAKSRAARTRRDSIRGLHGNETLGRLFRFGISGVIATGIHIAVATPLIYLMHASQPSANGVAFVVANVGSYLLNTLWSFGAKPGRDSYLRFLTVSLMGLGMTLAISVGAQALGAGYWAGLAAILSVVPAVTFVLHRRWTYR
ncbi:GtrA family protein [Cupriavidus oxalaticus]|jgi:putative flippase GtrA|uniref:Bactoprenol-linked glucose translocase (Flippase) GtrA n=1 Tax=Cupriavidus oxalaticus TaxID=96344 RepID=A0A375GDQ9_9BURK|nr:GtrA family protein [Cupriavidus oxalaticus]QRQ86753.1 GtrA family protein [Cupriavidus oxalaticus]QRQ94919.1 GtrA family protein [Cupriavidus oxalaticus]WQD83573.1 GtrA family protein [Cupriavidus oxalaticus]SPC16824.1 putative Bactoprenol-linked glucose translocase (Flippase) GtrA [Cupriavidus oxalaticus]